MTARDLIEATVSESEDDLVVEISGHQFTHYASYEKDGKYGQGLQGDKIYRLAGLTPAQVVAVEKLTSVGLAIVVTKSGKVKLR